MTRKDFRLIADLLRVVVWPRCKNLEGYKAIVLVTANTLEKNYKNFNEEKFREACFK